MVALILAVMNAILWTGQVGKSETCWISSNILFGLAFLSLAYFRANPNPYAGTLSAILLLSAIGLIWIGLDYFLGRTPKIWVVAGITVIGAAGDMYFKHAYPDPAARVLFNAISIIAVCSGILWTLQVQSRNRTLDGPLKLIFGIVGTYIGYLLLTVIAFLQPEIIDAAFVQPFSTRQILRFTNLIAFIVLFTTLTLAILKLSTNQRMALALDMMAQAEEARDIAVRSRLRAAEQKKLREISEERLRSVVEGSPVPYLMFDQHQRVLFVNRAFTDTFGYDLADVPTAQAWCDLAYPDPEYQKIIKAKWYKKLEDHERTGAPFKPGDLLVHTKSGAVLNVLGTTTALGPAIDGSYLAAMIDVTAIKKSETLLKSKYSAIVASTADAILAVDVAGIVTSWNPGAEHMFGYSAAEIMGRNVSRLIPLDQQADVLAIRDKLLRREPVTQMETVRLRKGGQRFPVSMTCSPIVDEANAIVGVSLIVRDITDRKKAEALAKSQFAAIVESSNDAIVGTDLNNIITSWNPAAEAMFGFTADEKIGTPSISMVPPEYLNNVPKIFNRVVSGQRVKNFEGKFIAKSGALIDVSITVSAIRDIRGYVVGTSTICRDVTHQHLLESRLRHSQKMEALGQLTGGIAHDLNNLLAVILGNSELIEDITEGSEVGRMSHRITRTAQQGAQLINRLMAFSRKADIKPVQVDVAAVLADTANTLRHTLSANIDIKVATESGDIRILADRAMLENSLINLGVNARDAMPDGGTLTFSVGVEKGGTLKSEMVVLTVTDTGCGMSEEVRAKVFDPFFTTKAEGRGTGLGLATVYGFVQQNHGVIDVESAPGKGTTFTLRFPRAMTAEAEAEIAHADEDTCTGEGHTVLLVEDNDAVRDTVSQQISLLGFKVLEAPSAAAAQALVKTGEKIDFVFSDFDLGEGLTGLQLAQWLKNENADVRGAIMSGYLDAPATDIASVGWRTLQKPVRKMDIVDALHGVCCAGRAISAVPIRH